MPNPQRGIPVALFFLADASAVMKSCAGTLNDRAGFNRGFSHGGWDGALARGWDRQVSVRTLYPTVYTYSREARQTCTSTAYEAQGVPLRMEGVCDNRHPADPWADARTMPVVCKTTQTAFWQHNWDQITIQCLGTCHAVDFWEYTCTYGELKASNLRQNGKNRRGRRTPPRIGDKRHNAASRMREKGGHNQDIHTHKRLLYHNSCRRPSGKAAHVGTACWRTGSMSPAATGCVTDSGR
ncbi:hypothetical protein GGR57DRAFT_197002 [Xylariaceae sp. FL1272]|nr:hypothetical protein GGR57DRAFT_197002 [Xylariaceae sp. FL1272]